MKKYVLLTTLFFIFNIASASTGPVLRYQLYKLTHATKRKKGKVYIRPIHGKRVKLYLKTVKRY